MKTLDPFEGLDDDDIRIAIANANGPRSSLFVPGKSLIICRNYCVFFVDFTFLFVCFYVCSHVCLFVVFSILFSSCLFLVR